MSIGRWSIRHPRVTVAAWITFVLACVALGALIGTKTLDNGAVGESARGYAIMNKDQLWGAPRELAYLHARGGVVPPAVTRDVERRFRALGLAPELKLSHDGHSVVVAALTREVAVERIRAAVAAAARAHTQLTIEETGDVSVDQARDRTVDRDLRRAELLAIPVTLLVLLFAFGSLMSALVPVLLALSAVIAGLGLLGPLSQLFPVEDSAKTVVLLIGMAVGVDYALFFVVRSRAERGRGATLEEALQTTLRTSGRTVVVSGATVAIAMAGMYIVGVRTLSGIATAAIAVIGCAVLGAVTVLPAALRLLGPRIDRGQIPLLPHAHTEGGSRFWSALVDRVTRRPIAAAALATTLLAALAYPALSLRLSKPSDLALTAQSEPALKALADVRRAFPDAGETAVVAVEAPTATRQQLHRKLERLSRRAVEEGVAHEPVDPIRTSPAGSGSAGALLLPLSGNGANSSSRRAIDELRQRLIPSTLGRIRGVETAVTGATAEDVDFTRQIRHALPYVLAFVLALAFALLLVAFRSIIVPLKAIALNLLSVAASYGVLALVFQHHWAEPILGFRSNGTIVSWLPLFLFVVLFGLSMDYHVFILSRVREAVDRGEPTETAVRRSIASTAGVVTAAAVVMVCVFALFGTLSSLELKQAGVGLAAAVLIDATLIRGVLLPATMKLLGDWNWYLPRQLRWLPRVAHERTQSPDELKPSLQTSR
jgi:RND superfamily putative drug exporter